MTAVLNERPTATPKAPDKAPVSLGRTPGDRPAGRLVYVVLAATIVLSIIPLYWAFVVATSTDEELAKVPPNFVPKSHFGDNLHAVLHQDSVYFVRAIIDSLFVCLVVTASVLFFAALAGFAFAKLKFRGRDVLFVIILATMAIPNQLGVVTLYVIMQHLGWNGQLKAVIVPGLVTAFGVFFMRQFILDAVPDELIESARVDGASTFRIFWSIVTPAIRPGAGVLGLFTFMATWNDVQWPLITLGQSEHPTIAVALSHLASGNFIVYSVLLCGALLATLPLLIVFLVAGKQFISGIMEGAVKS